MTVAEIKEMIKNMDNNDEVFFTTIDRDRNGHQVNTFVNVNNIFNKAEVTKMEKMYRFEILDMNDNHITFYSVRALSTEHAKHKTVAWLHECYPSKNLDDLQILLLL